MLIVKKSVWSVYVAIILKLGRILDEQRKKTTQHSHFVPFFFFSSSMNRSETKGIVMPISFLGVQCPFFHCGDKNYACRGKCLERILPN
jgi:hypothetical protein